MTTETSDEAYPARGPYYSTWGPLNGPILRGSDPPALGVVLSRNEHMPIGIAYPVGQVEHRRGPAVTFWLVIDKTELDGRWLCDGREFLRLGMVPRLGDWLTKLGQLNILAEISLASPPDR